jgi:hypothetical protein
MILYMARQFLIPLYGDINEGAGIGPSVLTPDNAVSLTTCEGGSITGGGTGIYRIFLVF